MIEKPLAEQTPETNGALEDQSVKNYLPLALILAGAVALSDQLTKLWALELLREENSLSVIGDFFRLTLVFNYGGAMGTNFGGPMIYLATGLAILGFLLYYLWTHRNIRWFAIPLGLIAGGAVGNLIDRVRLGKVVDWIDVDFFNISLFGTQIDRWWTFNIADSAISLSLIFLVWAFVFGPAKKKKEPEGVSGAIERELDGPSPPERDSPSFD